MSKCTTTYLTLLFIVYFNQYFFLFNNPYVVADKFYGILRPLGVLMMILD